MAPLLHFEENAQTRPASLQVPPAVQAGAGLQHSASPLGHDGEATQKPLVQAEPLRHGWSTPPAAMQQRPRPPGQAVEVAHTSDALHCPSMVHGCRSFPEGTQQLLLGAHCTLSMQVLDGALQVPPTQAGKGGSQHLVRPLGQARLVHWSEVLQASAGPQGWSLAPEGMR